MKEIKKERTTTQTYYEYEALDGTIFSDKEECKEYEKTAECAIMAKYKPLVLSSEHTENSLFGIGNSDDYIDLIKLKNPKDIDIVMQAWLVINKHLQDDQHKDFRESTYKMLKTAMEKDDIVFVNHGYANDNFWFDGTKYNMIDKMLALDNLINKDKTDEQN